MDEEEQKILTEEVAEQPDEAETVEEAVPADTATEESGPPEETDTEAEQAAVVEETGVDTGSETSDGTHVEEDADSGAPGDAESGDAEDGEQDDEEMIEPEKLLNDPPDDGVKRRWYAIHAHSGQEASVQESLKVQAELQGLSDQITNVFVPMEEVAEYKSGEKKFSKRKFFPGYLLVQLPEHPERHADLWHLIKDTPGVTGFIGSRTEPVPLEDSEVMALVEEILGERERPRPKVSFDLGERVKITDGAFANFLGSIGEVNEERAKMKVMIEIFERQTSVEVDFWQVEKI